MNTETKAVMNDIQKSIHYQKACDVSRDFAKINKNKNVLKISNEQLIEFYGCRCKNDTYGKWFTNCVVAPFIIDNVRYASSEHYFQYHKFCVDDDDYLAKWCSQNKTIPAVQLDVNNSVRQHMMYLSPAQVAQYGKNMKIVPTRADWDNEKLDVMWRAIVAKFQGNLEFKAVLLGTGKTVLVERTPRDSYWGINNKGIGENMLGLLLMTLRHVLQ